MAKKLPNHQRRRLQSQGRCFKCHKKGHKASGCTRNPAASLAELPVELLNQICEHIIFPNDDRTVSYASRMFGLRLTCRKINAKTLDLFASQAFGSILVRNCFEGFQRLRNISKIRALARGVRRLALCHSEGIKIGEHEYLRAKIRARAGESSSRENGEPTVRLRQAERESNNLTFFESSTSDGVLLADALSRLRNLENVLIIPPEAAQSALRSAPLRRIRGSIYPSATHTFSMLLACFNFAGIFPRQFTYSWVGGHFEDDAIDLQALAAPNVVLKQLFNLRKLTLKLRFEESTYRSECHVLGSVNRALFLSTC